MKAIGIVKEEVAIDGSVRVVYDFDNGNKACVIYNTQGITKITREALEFILELNKEKKHDNRDSN